MRPAAAVRRKEGALCGLFVWIKNEAALYRAWKNGAIHTTLNPKGPGAAIIYISVDEEAAGQAAATRIFTSRIKKEKLNRLNKLK